MPELPEVETVCRSLNQKIFEISKTPKITNIYLWRKDLRFKIPAVAIKKQFSQSILNIHRRAKFIVIEFKNNFIVSHLGMTGQWKTSPQVPELIKHDHLIIEFSEKSLVYNDPRRFGFVQVVANLKLPEYFSAVGEEPFKDLNLDTLQKIKRADRSIKTVLMDQKIVVGIGNIYASEALFRSKIKPSVKACRLSIAQIKLLYKIADEILGQAITAGGSSISNYLNAQQEKGRFQQQHLVYGREGEPCSVCGSKIVRIVQTGRSTFWCKACQK